MGVFEPFQDVAKAIGELRKLVHDVVGDGQTVWAAYERHTGKNAAGSLSVFSFQSNGTRQHLERIAAGAGQEADFSAIAHKLDETGVAVEKAIDQLQGARDYIRRKYGLGVANKLSDLIYGQGGKQSIRIDLQQLAWLGDSNDPNPEITQQNARLILETIAAFNKKVEAFHDAFLSLPKPTNE